MVGGMAVIARNGRIAYTETWGMKDREAGEAMTEDALFRIYSMSKPITGVALMMLYEEGKFFLNDPVAQVPPGAGRSRRWHVPPRMVRQYPDRLRWHSEPYRRLGDEDLTGQTRENRPGNRLSAIC